MTATGFFSTAVPLIVAAAIAVGGYSLSSAAAAWLRVRGASPPGVRAARVAISLTGFALASAVIFVAFGPIGIVPGLTFSALVGLAATLALQTTLQNIIAGFILLNNRALRLHDTIQIGGVSGTIVQIGFVTTWLHLPDGSVAMVSNSTLLSGPMINRSAADRLKGEY